MEMDELIRALLSLSLSQDLTFAKQIVYLFEENYARIQSLKDPKLRLLGEKKTLSKEERRQLSYSFQDFMAMFKNDLLGERIMTTIGREVVAIRKARERK